MSNRYIKDFKPNFDHITIYGKINKQRMWIKFKTIKLHSQHDKVLDNIKREN